MLHLYNRVYLESHGFIDRHVNRIVISDEHGYPMVDYLQKSARGELLAHAKSFEDMVGKNGTFSSFTDLLIALEAQATTTEEQVVIYCDKEAYVEVLARWLKSILPYASAVDAYKFVKSHAFKTKLFHSKRDIGRQGTPVEFSEKEWKTAWSNVNDKHLVAEEFVQSIRSELSVEFLLATYLATGELDAELLNILKTLVRKDAEDWLYELKELICTQLLNGSLRKALGITEPVELDTLNKVISTVGAPCDVFFDPAIWNTPDVISTASSAGTINLSTITDRDVNKIRDTINALGEVWPYERDMYLQDVDGISKLDILTQLSKGELTTRDLDAILAFEASDLPVSGFFHNLDLRTVNDFFVEYVLKQHAAGNLEAISPYRLL